MLIPRGKFKAEIYLPLPALAFLAPFRLEPDFDQWDIKTSYGGGVSDVSPP